MRLALMMSERHQWKFLKEKVTGSARKVARFQWIGQAVWHPGRQRQEAGGGNDNGGMPTSADRG